jgi:hypothetical protein
MGQLLQDKLSLKENLICIPMDSGTFISMYLPCWAWGKHDLNI